VTDDLAIQNIDEVLYLFAEGPYKLTPGTSSLRKLGGKVKSIKKKGAQHGFLLENSYSIRTQFCRGECEHGGEWKLMIIDDDDKKNPVRRAAMKKIFVEEWELPYTETANGVHYYVKIVGCPRVSETEVEVFSGFMGDLFGSRMNGNNVWENCERQVRNFPDNGKIPIHSFAKLAPLLGNTFFDRIVPEDMTPELEEFKKAAKPSIVKPKAREEKAQSNSKTKTVKKRVKKKVDGKTVEVEVIEEVELNMKEKLQLMKKDLDKKKGFSSMRYIPGETELKKLLKCADPDMTREDWLQVCCAIKGFGEHLFDVFDDWSSFEFCPDEYFDFLDDDPESDTFMEKDEWINLDANAGGSRYDFDSCRHLWDDGGLNKPGSRVIGWHGLKQKIKLWYPEAYDRYFEAYWEQTVKKQLILGDRQFIDIFAAFLDIVIDASDASDYLSEDSKNTKSFFKYEDNGFWKFYESGQSDVIMILFKKIVDGMLAPKIEEINAANPEMFLADKDKICEVD